jgi:hypothetical protein
MKERELLMSRITAVFVGTMALSLMTVAAGAEECAPEDSGLLSVENHADAQPATETPAVADAADATDAPDFEPLTEDELAVLEDAAAMNPELADKAGGYVSNEELLTIVVVVLLVIIIL